MDIQSLLEFRNTLFPLPLHKSGSSPTFSCTLREGSHEPLRILLGALVVGICVDDGTCVYVLEG